MGSFICFIGCPISLGLPGATGGISPAMGEGRQLLGKFPSNYAPAPAPATEPSASLHAAAREGGVDAIRNLVLVKGASPDSRDTLGRTPLHEACARGHVAAAEELLRRGARVHLRRPNGFTALHYAAAGGHSRVSSLLLAWGAAPGEADRKQETPLHLAARAGSLETVEVLLAASPEGCSLVHRRNCSGRTPLHSAALHGHIECVERLLRSAHGLRGGAGGGCGEGRRKGSEQRRWDEAGASSACDPKRPHACASAPDLSYSHSLPGTPALSNTQAVPESGHTQSRDECLSPLAPARDKSGQMVRGEVNGEGNNSQEVPESGQRGGGEVSGEGNKEWRGEDVKACAAAADSSGTQPLHDAAGGGHLGVVHLLLAAGADPDARDSAGLTPLHRAAAQGHTDVLEELMSTVKEVCPRDKSDSTPLYWAASRGEAGAVAWLLGHPGYSAADRNRHRSALEVAEGWGHMEAAEVLRMKLEEEGSL